MEKPDPDRMMQILVFLSVLIQLIVWLTIWYGYRTICSRKSGYLTNSDYDAPGLSVIVAARNEADSLEELIGALDSQTWTKYEVLIVDDASTDATASIVRGAMSSRPWLKLVSIDEPRFPRKKHALAAGIEQASYPVLVFTDADCVPGPEWLSSHGSVHARTDAEAMVLGSVELEKRRGMLNRFQRFMQTLNTTVAAATIGFGRAFLAFGGNLSYSRTLFDRVGGYGAGLRSLSGDDILFLQRVRRFSDAQIIWLTDSRSRIRTTAPRTTLGYILQKRRHVSNNRYAGSIIQIVGGLHVLSLIGVALAPSVIGWTGVWTWVLVSGVIAVALRPSFSNLNQRETLHWLPLLLILYVVFNAILPIWGILVPPKRWRDSDEEKV
jgi:cellulose synthase/poly-beta-1,6-N-acetylglucosamine synthase-like glycosyltransferase